MKYSQAKSVVHNINNNIEDGGGGFLMRVKIIVE